MLESCTLSIALILYVCSCNCVSVSKEVACHGSQTVHESLICRFEGFEGFHNSASCDVCLQSSDSELSSSYPVIEDWVSSRHMEKTIFHSDTTWT